MCGHPPGGGHVKDGIPDGRILGGVWFSTDFSSSNHYYSKPFELATLLIISPIRFEAFVEISSQNFFRAIGN